MKIAYLFFALSLSIAAPGCWYTSQPTDSPIGTGCKTQTFGLAVLSSANTTCETSAQPPTPDIAPGPAAGGPGPNAAKPAAPPSQNQ